MLAKSVCMCVRGAGVGLLLTTTTDATSIMLIERVSVQEPNLIVPCSLLALG